MTFSERTFERCAAASPGDAADDSDPDDDSGSGGRVSVELHAGTHKNKNHFDSGLSCSENQQEFEQEG